MNSELYDKTYNIPTEILNKIRATLISNPNDDGIKRAKNMINGGVITYQGLKRLKNYFDHFNPDIDNPIQYQLAGGEPMKNFVNQTLNSDRDAIERSKNIKSDININHDLGIKAFDTPRLNKKS